MKLVTYKSGFARHPHVSEYPPLLEGLRSVYCPFLGSTGSTLRSVGPFQNHGTLTDMDPATDWVISNGQHVLDFDGSNDKVVVPQTTTLGGNGIHSIAIRLMVRNIPTFVSGNNQRVIALFDWNANRGRYISLSDAQSDVTGRVSYVIGDSLSFDVVNSVTNLQENVWYSIVCAYDGNNLIIYIDGERDNSEIIGSRAINDDTLLDLPSQLNAGFDGQIAFAGFWGRELRPPEVLVLHEDLPRFLRVRHVAPPRKALFVPGGAPTPYYYHHLLGA